MAALTKHGEELLGLNARPGDILRRPISIEEQRGDAFVAEARAYSFYDKKRLSIVTHHYSSGLSMCLKTLAAACVDGMETIDGQDLSLQMRDTFVVEEVLGMSAEARIRRLWMRAAEHEYEEQLMCNGKWVYDPHGTGRCEKK